MTLEEIYLDWVNNFFTTEKMAEHYGIDRIQLESIIEHSRNIRKLREKRSFTPQKAGTIAQQKAYKDQWIRNAKKV